MNDKELAHYNRLFNDRERRRNEMRHISSVINWYGKTIRIDGWHDGVSVVRTVIPDDFKFGPSQSRRAPTNRKAR